MFLPFTRSKLIKPNNHEKVNTKYAGTVFLLSWFFTAIKWK